MFLLFLLQRVFMTILFSMCALLEGTIISLEIIWEMCILDSRMQGVKIWASEKLSLFMFKWILYNIY
jgi:hypothetical protein